MAVPPTVVDSTGVSAPSYEEILQGLRDSFWSIYGSDANLDPDSQDGEWLAVLARGFYDSGQAVVAVYNSFSPATAQGAALSNSVKINGLRRDVATNSQAVVRIIGVAGTIINNGIVGDNLSLNTQWTLPAVVTIPVPAAQIDVTATCTTEGDVSAAANSLTVILTPTLGWQSVSNLLPAVLGAPIETDAALRRRQSRSTTAPALTPLEAISAEIANVSGVRREVVYENDLDTTGANGIPSHSISAVVSGGDVQEVAEAIAAKKAPGTGTYGTTNAVVIDEKGIPNTINFFELAEVTITTQITIQELLGYVSSTGSLMKAVVAAYQSALDIGESVYLARMYSAANLSGDIAQSVSGLTQAQLDALSATYVVTSILMSRAGPPVAADVSILFNEAAIAATGNVSLVVI